MDIEKLKADLKIDEGLRLKPYKCSAGAWTIGYGHNLPALDYSDEIVQKLFGKGITEQQAEQLLNVDINKALQDTKNSIPNYDNLTEQRQRAFVNMMFNLGMTRFKKFKKMLNAIKLESWNDAIMEMKQSLWYQQVKNRADRLIGMII